MSIHDTQESVLESGHVQVPCKAKRNRDVVGYAGGVGLGHMPEPALAKESGTTRG